MNAEKLGFIKGELYELEKDNVRYRLPNQKLPFLKKDFHVKNSYADFMIEDIEISISIYDGKDFAIEFNHFRSIKGCFDKDSNIEIMENTLNEKENILYTENNEIKYDEEVLTLREKFEIKDRIPKFIVYHLMGSHPDFRLRSPQNFKLFDCDDYVCNNDCYNSQVLAEYDNSIYYNDFVVNSIISCYQDSNSLVIYLSDHALDLFQTDCDYAGHAKANKESTKVGVEIPFWIYVSPKFKKNNPQMVERINNSRNKPFMTDDLIYVIMDIMGVEFKDNPNKVSEHSFLSIKYKNRIRIINGFNIDN